MMIADGMNVFSPFLPGTRRLRAFVPFSLALSCVMTTPSLAQSFKTNVPIAYLFDVKTNSVLFDKAADELFPPASIIKLLTAETVFTALKSGKIRPETEVFINEQIWRKGGAPSRGSAMFAAVRSRVGVTDLLKGLIVMSGNDAALALAEGVGGTEEAFVTLMQERARAIGLTRSQIRNATGFSHSEQKVTAKEMARLAGHIIQNHPEYYPLFAEREFTWNGIRQLSRNPLLTMNIGADGLKTGNIGEAGFGLVGSAVRDDRRLIVVIMGAETAVARASEARRLLEWGFDNFSIRKLLERRVHLAELKVSGGTSGLVPVGIGEDLALFMPVSVQDVVETSIRFKSPLMAPIVDGAEIGTLVVTRNGTIAAERPVIALQDVPQGSLAKRAFDNLSTWFLGLFRRNDPVRAVRS
jgi:serine-type D-Ala-D-Ala carboxypeptidase (penicillin-binding protein 5/6)